MSVRDRLEYAIYVVGAALVRLLPLALVKGVAGGLARQIFDLGGSAAATRS